MVRVERADCAPGTVAKGEGVAALREGSHMMSAVVSGKHSDYEKMPDFAGIGGLKNLES